MDECKEDLFFHTIEKRRKREKKGLVFRPDGWLSLSARQCPNVYSPSPLECSFTDRVFRAEKREK